VKVFGPISAPDTTPVSVGTMVQDYATEFWTVLNDGNSLAEFSFDDGGNWVPIPAHSTCSFRSTYLNTSSVLWVRAASGGGPVTGFYVLLGLLLDMHPGVVGEECLPGNEQISIRRKLPYMNTPTTVDFGRVVHNVILWVEQNGHAHVSFTSPATKDNMKVDDTMVLPPISIPEGTRYLYLLTSSDVSTIYYNILAR
jgi:hypothetical protein